MSIQSEQLKERAMAFADKTLLPQSPIVKTITR